MFELGTFLRKRYDKFLGRDLKLNVSCTKLFLASFLKFYGFQELHAQTTDVPRTKMSLELVLAGLYPPKDTATEWNTNLNWQPIPYSWEPIFEDILLIGYKSCPRYQQELERVYAEDVKQEMDENSRLYQELSQFTGLNLTSPFEVQLLFNTLKAEVKVGFNLMINLGLEVAFTTERTARRCSLSQRADDRTFGARQSPARG